MLKIGACIPFDLKHSRYLSLADDMNYLGLDTVQVFLGSETHLSKLPELSSTDVMTFRKRTEGKTLICHAPFVINYCRPMYPGIRQYLQSLIKTLLNLGFSGMVFHPGASANKELGRQEFIKHVYWMASLTEGKMMLLPENSAGKGVQVFNSLPLLFRSVSIFPKELNVRVCLDTAHAQAAQDDLNTKEVQRIILDNKDLIGLLHLNGTQEPLGSFRDRHCSFFKLPDSTRELQIKPETLKFFLNLGKPMILEHSSNRVQQEIQCLRDFYATGIYGD